MPSRPDLAQYVKRAEDLVNSAQSQNTSALKEFCNDWFDEIVRLSGPDLTDFVRGSYERAIGEVEKGAREASTKRRRGWPWEFGLAGAQFLIARAHSFVNWDEFATFMSTGTRARPMKGPSSRSRPMPWSTGTSRSSRRSCAVIRRWCCARSARIHRATLVYYLAANGVEDFRQRSPANAPEIARFLLECRRRGGRPVRAGRIGRHAHVGAGDQCSSTLYAVWRPN